MFETSFIDLLISFYQIKSTNKCCITLPKKVIFFFQGVMVLLLNKIIFQSTPFGQITYDIIGDDSAPSYFSINQVTGRISIARSLTEQSVEEYRVGQMTKLYCFGMIIVQGRSNMKTVLTLV